MFLSQYLHFYIMRHFLLHFLLALIFSTCLVSSVLAQSKNVSATSWYGLVIDKSTPEDAVKLFGKPRKRKTNKRLEILRATSWLSGKYDEKVFTTLSYRNLKVFWSVKFGFLDNKLVLVSMEKKDPTLRGARGWIDPDDLGSIFDLEFKPYRRKLGKTRPGPIEFRDKAPKYLKKKEHYYFWYDMMAVGEDTFVIAIANNDKNLIGGTLIPSDPTDLGKARARKVINSKGVYPGYVQGIQIISRVLEKKKELEKSHE